MYIQMLIIIFIFNCLKLVFYLLCYIVAKRVVIMISLVVIKSNTEPCVSFYESIHLLQFTVYMEKWDGYLFLFTEVYLWLDSGILINMDNTRFTKRIVEPIW